VETGAREVILRSNTLNACILRHNGLEIPIVLSPKIEDYLYDRIKDGPRWSPLAMLATYLEACVDDYIYRFMEIPFDDLPLHINDTTHPICNAIIAWRLEHAK
jgi:hypothetical protein